MFTTVSKNHIFYEDAKENLKKPPWFIDCDRNEAEEILKKFQHYGNVLIRPSKNGSYAVSAATKLNGEVKFVHYQITRTTTGFKLEVQSKPPPMPSLYAVLDYYVNAAGIQDHRGLVIAPEGLRCPGNDDKKYVDMSKPKKQEQAYVPMNGNSKRRSSAPAASIEYINVSKGADCDGEEYVNVNGSVAKPRSKARHSLSANGYPPRNGKNDRGPLPPIEQIYLEPSNADEDIYLQPCN